MDGAEHGRQNFSNVALPHPGVQKLMQEYSKVVQQDGQFLGMADLALLASGKNAQVLTIMCNEDVEGVPPLMPLNKTLEDITGGALQAHGGASPDLSLHSTWVVAWCSASYEKVRSQDFHLLNHCLPAFSKLQLDDLWENASEALRSKQSQRIAKLRKQISKLSDDSDGAVEASLQDRLRILENKQRFFNLLLDNGLLPVDVPADGNCQIWSALTLKAGCTLRDNVIKKEKIRECRWDAW